MRKTLEYVFSREFGEVIELALIAGLTVIAVIGLSATLWVYLPLIPH